MTFYKLWLFTLSILYLLKYGYQNCSLTSPRGKIISFQSLGNSRIGCMFIAACIRVSARFLGMSFLLLNYIFGLKIMVKGKENLRTKKPFILMLNDQTSLDIMVMMEVLPSRCVPIARKEILYMGTFSLVCWLSGLIFIDHKKREEYITTLIEVAHSLHKENFRILIFPEGTCSHGSFMLPFKHGAFQLAVKAQVPIIPVVISSYYDFHNQKEKRFRPGKSIIQIPPEVETLGLASDDVPKHIEQVRDSMLTAYQGISGMTNGTSH